MAFLRSALVSEETPVLRGQGLTLRVPSLNDYGQWAELRAISREHLRPWEPEWARDELSQATFRRRVRHYQKDLREENSYAFLIIDTQSNTLVGGVTLFNIRRGVTQSVSIGYWIGLPHTRQGYMTRAVCLAADFVFKTLHLHRLEAACLATNTGSIAVLRKNGFRHEGLARKYLKINGKWQDHILFALLDEDYHRMGFGGE